MNNKRRVTTFFLTILALASSSLASANLIMSAPPRETPEAGKLLYEPIADHISRITGQKVIYEHPKSWLNYQKQMRANRYDIVFDGPHFMSWRMSHAKHTPLAKLPGKLRFVIITHASDDSINRVEDLVGKKVCGLAPPNLATLVFYSRFPNPVRQPNFVAIQGGFNKVFLALKSRQCDAAVFRDGFYQTKLSAEERTLTKIIFTSAPLPNQGITVHKLRITSEQRHKIVQSLLSDAGKEATRPLLNRFAKKADGMIPTSSKEYEGHNRYIEGVIFGW